MRRLPVYALLFVAVLKSGFNTKLSAEEIFHGQYFNDSIFVLKGKISGQKSGLIKLIYTDAGGNYITDSCRIKKSRFVFRGHIKEPTKVYLEGSVAGKNMNDPNFTSFFVEPGTINIRLESGQFKKAEIKGSKTQDEHAVYEKAIKPILEEAQPFVREFEDANRKLMEAQKAEKDENSLEELKLKAETARMGIEPFSARIRNKEREFFREYPQSFVTAFQLQFHLSDLPLDSLEAYYERLGSQTRQSKPGLEIGRRLEQIRKGSPGSIAPEFSATNIDGQPLSLSNYRGRYILLDFWASWCIPCRKGNPHLRELYAKYKARGIEFIGISDDDREPKKWKDAIAKDSIGHWKQVLRGLKFVNNSFDHRNDINEKYGVGTLPTRILIDPSGKIVGRFGEKDGPLDEMLKNIFGF